MKSMKLYCMKEKSSRPVKIHDRKKGTCFEDWKIKIIIFKIYFLMVTRIIFNKMQINTGFLKIRAENHEKRTFRNQNIIR